MTPRIKHDLKAAPVEEGGILYFDVSDPRSGATQRLYDFEWLIAQKLDGATSLSELASWAGTRFGFTPSTEDLRAYAEKLHQLGLAEPSAAPEGASAGNSTSIIIDEQPAAASSQREPSEPSIEIEVPPSANYQSMSFEQPTTPRMDAVRPDPVPIPARVEPPRPAPPAEPVRPVASTTSQTAAVPEEAPEKKKGSGMTILLVLLLLAAIAGAIYYFVIMPGMQPVKVKVSLAPSPREVVRFYEGKGTVTKGEPVTMSFGESGKVADVVAAGTDAKPGMTLASLEAAQAVAKELADVRDREAFYAGQLKAAQAKGDAAEVKKFQEKVDEKKKRAAELTEREKRVRLVAAGGGAVGEVMIQAGATVKEGDAALKLVDKRMVARFTLPAADAATLRAGQTIAVAPESAAASGAGPTAAARVIASDGSGVKAELLDDGGGAIKSGDAVSLVKSKIPNVVREPAAVLRKSQGGADQVFVLSNGVLHARPVTVVEKTDAEVFISSGLTTGESVVVGGGGEEPMADGQKAVAE